MHFLKKSVKTYLTVANTDIGKLLIYLPDILIYSSGSAAFEWMWKNFYM